MLGGFDPAAVDVDGVDLIFRSSPAAGQNIRLLRVGGQNGKIEVFCEFVSS